MSGKHRTNQHKINSLFLLAGFAVACLSAVTPISVQAQIIDPNTLSEQQTTQPNTAPPTSFAPPIGSAPNGTMPPPEIPGDNIATTNPTKWGQADQTGGSMFSTQPGYDRSVVHVYTQTTTPSGLSRGLREVQTIRLDQLSQSQIGQVESALGITVSTGEENIPVTVTTTQLANLQNIMAAWPNGWQMTTIPTSGVQGKQITSDSPGTGYHPTGGFIDPQADRTSHPVFGSTLPGPIPTVKVFARYLVITGVCCSTVYMALAATSVAFGSKYGGARVIGAAGGLILLLMGYTIWKVVQLNTFSGNSTTVVNESQLGGNQVSAGSMQTGPGTPAAPTSGGRAQPQRSGIPLFPLGDAGRS